MKTMKTFFIVFLAILFNLGLSAQNKNLKNESFKVSGNCDMCKNRIETAAKSAGATSASWDVKSKMLAVTFDASQTNSDAIAKKVAMAGHDAKNFKAEEKTYKSLPACCQYDRSGKPGQSDEMNHSHEGHTMPSGHSMH
jgi:copper chaperone CopZ